LLGKCDQYTTDEDLECELNLKKYKESFMINEYMETDIPALNNLFKQWEQEEIDALKRDHRGRRMRHIHTYEYDDSEGES
jgi:hypothetical protein